MLTPTIGSFPKPDFVPVRDWFQDSYTPTHDASYFATRELETRFAVATKDAVEAQIEAGIDVPTDGEMRRENYIFYHLRHLDGIDFDKVQTRPIRTGAWELEVPTIVDRVTARDRFLAFDYQIAQSYSTRPVKITVPGPMTIADTIADEYYGEDHALNRDLADAINIEIRALADAGCQHIQVDEPVFARNPAGALAYGIDNLERCFRDLPKQVTRIVHLCCGYPRTVDEPNEDVLKANSDSYFELAPALDEAAVDAVSLEDAHRNNDLALLERFEKTQVILGLIAIARTRIETEDEISHRLTAALDHIDADRLTAAPDCGLGMLDKHTALAKLQNLARAAKHLPG